VDPMKKYPFLSPLLSPFEKRHQKTLALVIAAIATTAQARSFAIATTMARWLGTRLDSAVNRFYRLLRNARVDYIELQPLLLTQRRVTSLLEPPALRKISALLEMENDQRSRIARANTIMPSVSFRQTCLTSAAAGPWSGRLGFEKRTAKG